MEQGTKRETKSNRINRKQKMKTKKRNKNEKQNRIDSEMEDEHIEITNEKKKT